jgi:glycosyl transferase family 25
MGASLQVSAHISVIGTPLASEEYDIVILSVPGDHDRKSYQIDQMQRLGLDYEIIDAVRPDGISRLEMSRRIISWNRRLRLEEVACALTHRAAWSHVVASGRPTVVLEDDVILCASFELVIRAAVDLAPSEYVQLETVNRRKLVHVDATSLGCKDYEVRRLFRERYGSAAYLIWPEAARRVLAMTIIATAPSDVALNVCSGISRSQILPACAIQMSSAVARDPAFGHVAHMAGTTVRKSKRPSEKSRWLRMRYQLRTARLNGLIRYRRWIARGRSNSVVVDFTGE